MVQQQTPLHYADLSSNSGLMEVMMGDRGISGKEVTAGAIFRRLPKRGSRSNRIKLVL